MNFEELLEKTKSYRMSENLEDLIKAKIMLDEHSPENFSQEENQKIGDISARLMREIGDIFIKRRGENFVAEDNDTEDSGIFTIRIPAGRKS
jgi:hypothetical protein